MHEYEGPQRIYLEICCRGIMLFWKENLEILLKVQVNQILFICWFTGPFTRVKLQKFLMTSKTVHQFFVNFV